MDKMEEGQRSSFTSQKVMSFGNTPKRSIVRQRVDTPLQNMNETPDKKTEMKTQAIINPFEVKADSLYFPSCSPSVFATFAKNKTDKGKFKWSIDHISFLYPADIDETSVPDNWVDPDQEAKAQKAIDAFFSQESILPSPWSSESKHKREERRITRKTSFFCPTKDVGVQTKVTLPPNVDLLALLGEKFAYNEEKNDTVYSSPTSSNGSFRDLDVMSTSSLRRKLFTADEGCETPTKLEQIDLIEVKSWRTPTSSMKSIHTTPSDLLASSPKTSPICSEHCSIRGSPQMSPIAGPSQKSFRMRRIKEINKKLDEESNSQKPSSEVNHTMNDNSMSFCMDSQDAGAFQSYVSEKQDTGYVTGSQFSLQNVTSNTTTGALQSHITPVAELFDDCAMSNVCSDLSCVSENNNMSIDCENLKCKNAIIPSSFEYQKWSMETNSCSTPAFIL